MGGWYCVAFFTLLVVSTAVNATLFITAPNVFRAGVSETVVISLIPSEGEAAQVTVNLYLRTTSNIKFSQVNNIVVNTGESQTVILTVEPNRLVQNGGRFQHMFLGAQGSNGFEKEEEILVTLRAGYVFVQTDKPIYTPNQKVKVRVMSLDQDMRPSDRELHVEVINPQGIIVTRFRQTRANHGFLEDEFSFSPNPMFGHWSVVASYGREFQVNSTVKFEVKEYVLPTFSVKVIPEKYILNGSLDIATTIKATYVYGKPVIGSFLFKFGVEENGNVTNLGERRGQLNDGSVAVTLNNLDATLGHGWFNRFRGKRFHTEAIVYETSTGFSEAGINNSAIFVSTPYKFSHQRTVQYFKRGLIAFIKLDLTFANGLPASRVPTQISATAILADDREETLRGGREGDGLISNTDENGRSDFRVGVPAEAKLIRVECFTVDPNYRHNQASHNFELHKAESDNDAFIYIENTNQGKIPVEESLARTMTVYRSGNDNDVDIYYLFVTSGKIVEKGCLRNKGNVVTLDDLVTTQEMVPRTRLVVYYITSDGHVIADSLLLELEERCHGDVSVNVPEQPDGYRPHEQVTMQVRAPPNSFVGLLAVDKAVYLLQDYHRLTKRKMFNRMKSYDIGCGPGGGRNAEQTFEDSGLMVLTSAELDLERREDMSCSVASRRRRSADDGCLELDSLTEACPSLDNKRKLLKKLKKQGWPCDKQALIISQECRREHGIFPRSVMQEYQECCESSRRSSQRQALLGDRSSNTDFGRSADIDDPLADVEEGDVDVRNDFRETWIFDLVQVGGEGIKTKVTSAPSSITEWKMTAVSISPDQGMCIDDSTSIRVFQSFFIQLHLPYSVVRLEQTQIVVTVFNYRNYEQEISVNYTVVDGLCSGGAPGSHIVRTVRVLPNNAATTTFVVLPVRVGEYPIRIAAGPGRALDIVEKKLRVVAQGKTKRVMRSVLLNPAQLTINDNGDVVTVPPANIGADPLLDNELVREERSQRNVIQLQSPPDAIPDTQYCSVSMIGNLLGTIAANPIDNVERLVQQPTGCGEQTMIRLAPTVYTYKYLKGNDEDTAELEERVFKFLEDGIRREMNYRRPSGAFSAFQSRPGSTWLTAFVIKVFSQASEFAHVDPRHIEQSLNWLTQNMRMGNGAFRENNHVIHQEMIGAVKGDISMTAFVLISLIESRVFLEERKGLAPNRNTITAITSAVRYLEGEIDNLQKVYDMAIVTYALALARSGRVDDANDKLKENAESVEDSEAVYWTPDKKNYNNNNRPYWLQHRPSAIEVETTAYALLAQMALGEYNYAGRIVSWLSNQQQYGGGFVSTQDTVVALQALAIYAERPEFGKIDMECTVRSEGDDVLAFNYRHTFINDNAKVQEEFDVSAAIGKRVAIQSTGEGIAKADVQLLYNTILADQHCPFFINVSASELRDRSGAVSLLNISVCTRYRNLENSTKMSIIDVGVYSGFVAVPSDLKNTVANNDLIGKYETTDRSIIFYVDEIPNDHNLCLSFKARRDVIVGNTQPAAITVYDYYDTEQTCTTFYKPNDESPLRNSLCSPNECICSNGQCTPLRVRSTQAELLEAACTSDRAYALKINITSKVSEAGFSVYNFTVANPLKTGVDNTAAGEIRQLFVDEACEEDVTFRLDKIYLLIGSSGLKFTNENGQDGFKYIVDSRTMAEFWPTGRALNKQKARAVNQKLTAVQTQLMGTGCSA